MRTKHSIRALVASPTFLALLAAGCGNDGAGTSEPGLPDGGGLEGGSDVTPSEAGAPSEAGGSPSIVAGSIAVGTYRSGWVMLGDGTKFLAPAIPDGKVVFTDPTIVGPQTVSFARVDDNRVEVTTLAGIERPEVWIGTPPPLPTVERASLFASTPGAPAGDSVNILATGSGLFGSGIGTAGTPVAVPVYGPAAATSFDLIGWSRTDQNMTRVGFIPAVGLPAVPASGEDAPTVPVSVPLDRACDRTMNLTIEHAATYDPTSYVSLRYMLPSGSSASMLTFTSDESSISLAGFALTAPFDGFRPYINVVNGDRAGGRGASTDVPVPKGEGAVVASLLTTTPTLLTPSATRTGSGAPVTTPLPPGTPFTWSGVSPSAQVVQLAIRGKQKVEDGRKALNWNVMLPGGRTSFTPFTLPSQIDDLTTFPSGTASIVITQMIYGGGTTLDEVFGARFGAFDYRVRGAQSSSYSADVIVP